LRARRVTFVRPRSIVASRIVSSICNGTEVDCDSRSVLQCS
jgi:hypothetical protein